MDIVVVLAFSFAAVLLVATVALVVWTVWPRHSIADEVEAWLRQTSPYDSPLS